MTAAMAGEAEEHLTFESARLRIRPLRLEDIDLIEALWGDPEVTRYLGGACYTREVLAEELPTVTRRSAGGWVGIWVMADRQTGEALGEIFLLPMPVDALDTDWSLVVGEALPEGMIELGYLLTKPACGQGYATEAAKALLAAGFTHGPFREIWAVTDDENTASQRVLRKAGLRDAGEIKACTERVPGFCITRAEWQAARP